MKVSYLLEEEFVVLDTSCLHVEVERKSGSTSYFDVHGKLLLKERSYESKYVVLYLTGCAFDGIYLA